MATTLIAGGTVVNATGTGKADVLIYHHRACSPCWGKGDCLQNDCMMDISAVEIMEAADRLLAGKERL